jgi:hypothetical protein
MIDKIAGLPQTGGSRQKPWEAGDFDGNHPGFPVCAAVQHG